MANWQHVTLSKHQTNLLFIKMTPFKKPGMGGRLLDSSIPMNMRHENIVMCKQTHFT